MSVTKQGSKDATVYFGTTSATNITDVNATTITASSPTGVGIVDVSSTSVERAS